MLRETFPINMISLFSNGKMVFAKLKNFFAKLTFSPPIFFCSERFPFSKKVLAGKKINLTKKFFNLAKKIGPFEISNKIYEIVYHILKRLIKILI